MKNRFLMLASLTVAGLLLSGCAVKTGNDKLEDTTSQTVSDIIKKDKTTKDEVKSNFGEPSKVDFMTNGLEKWEYEHTRKQSKAVNFIPVANWVVGGTNDTKKTLVILFDGDIVKNYSVAVAEGETKAGLFQ